MRKSILLSIALFAATLTGYANPGSETATSADSGVAESNPSLFARHFAWGAEIGSSVDLTNQSMTAIDIDASVGYKGDYLRFAGVGAGIKMMSSNSSRCYPIYGVVRSSFTRNPSLCFAEIKAGISLNNFYTNTFQRQFYGSAGIGFTLASGRSFSSNITLSYEFMPVKTVRVTTDYLPLTDIHSASIRIGVTF